MYRTIIWATDGSEHADRALPFVRELALLTKATIVVVHGEERFAAGRSFGDIVSADEPELLGKIRNQVKRLWDDGFAVELELVEGSAPPAELIAKAARDRDADLIVVGTRGHGPLAGALVGSVAQHLLHDAPCPVFAVPARVAVAAEPREPVVA